MKSNYEIYPGRIAIFLIVLNVSSSNYIWQSLWKCPVKFKISMKTELEALEIVSVSWVTSTHADCWMEFLVLCINLPNQDLKALKKETNKCKSLSLVCTIALSHSLSFSFLLRLCAALLSKTHKNKR